MPEALRALARDLFPSFYDAYAMAVSAALATRAANMTHTLVRTARISNNT